MQEGSLHENMQIASKSAKLIGPNNFKITNMRDYQMRMVLKFISLGVLALPLFSLTGCAMYDTSEEALQRADRALEQAEMCNQRVDRLTDAYGGK